MNLTSHLRTLTYKFPQVEPFLYLVPHIVKPDDEFDGLVPTAYTDGERCVYQETFFNSLPRPKQLGLILHETFHIVLEDVCPAPNAWVDKTISFASFLKLRNIAQDIRLEMEIIKLSEYDQPSLPHSEREVQSTYDEKELAAVMKYKGWAWREIYEDLKTNATILPPNFDSHDKFGKATPDTQLGITRLLERAREDSERIKERLAEQGKGVGDLAVKPETSKVEWEEVLREHLIAVPAPAHLSWRKLDRRSLSRGEYAQGLTGARDALEEAHLMIDTSGSMHDQLNKVAGAVLDLFNQLGVKKVSILFYDIGILERRDIEDLGTYTFDSMPSGGGTCIAGALTELVQDESYKPIPLVVLTDGYDDYRIPAEVRQALGPMFFVSYGIRIDSEAGPCVLAE